MYAIGAHSFGASGILFYQEEFIRRAPKDWPKVFGSIYTVACNLCVQATSHQLKEWGTHLRVSYVIEQGHVWQHEADEFLTALGNDGSWSADFRFQGHAFRAKAEAGLQAADLYAWSITKAAIADGHAPPALRPFWPSIAALGKGSTRFRLFEFTGDILQQFIDGCYQEDRDVLYFARRKGKRKAAFR